MNNNLNKKLFAFINLVKFGAFLITVLIILANIYHINNFNDIGFLYDFIKYNIDNLSNADMQGYNTPISDEEMFQKIQEEIQKEIQEELQEAIEKAIQEQIEKEIQETQKEIQEKIQKELQEEIQEMFQKIQEDIQEEIQKEIQEEIQKEIQNKKLYSKIKRTVFFVLDVAIVFVILYIINEK